MMATMVFIMCFLVFMLATLGCAEKSLYEEINVLKEFEDWEAEEGDGVELSDLPSFTKGRGNKVLVNVDSFGAVGDGVADDTKVIFLLIWLT